MRVHFIIFFTAVSSIVVSTDRFGYPVLNDNQAGTLFENLIHTPLLSFSDNTIESPSCSIYARFILNPCTLTCAGMQPAVFFNRNRISATPLSAVAENFMPVSKRTAKMNPQVDMISVSAKRLSVAIFTGYVQPNFST